MSFALTTSQISNRTKTVTRRLGWKSLKPGTLLQAVEKSQGLKKGEKVRKLAVIRVVAKHRGALSQMLDRGPFGYSDDCAREGFPKMSPEEFVAFFTKANRCDRDEWVTRIEFEYVDEAGREFPTAREAATR